MTRAQAPQSPAPAWRARSASKVARLPWSQAKASASAAEASRVRPRDAQSAAAVLRSLGGLGARTEASSPRLEHAGAVVGVAGGPEDRRQAVELRVGRRPERQGATPLVRHGFHVPRRDERLGAFEPQLPLGTRLEGQEPPQRVGQADPIALGRLDPTQRIERPPVRLVPARQHAPEAKRQLGIGRLGRLRDASDGAQRRRVARLGLEDPDVGVGGAPRRRQPLLAELCQDEEEPDPLLGTGLGLGQRLERAGELAPPLQLPVEPLQRRQRPGGQRRVEPARLLVEVRRLGRASERPLEQRSEPQRHRTPAGLQPRKSLREQRGELLVPTGRGVDLLQDRARAFRVAGHRALHPGERLDVVRMSGQDPVEQHEGACRVLEVVVAERREPRSQRVRLRVPPGGLGGGERPRQELGEGGRVGGEELRVAGELVHPGERPGVLRQGGERGAERRERSAAIREPVLPDAPGSHVRVGCLRRAAGPVGSLLGLLVEQRGHLRPGLARPVGVEEPVARDLGDFRPEVPANAEIADEPRPIPKRGDERRPGLARTVDPGQCRQRVHGRFLGEPLLDRGGEDLGKPVLDVGRVRQPAERGAEARLRGRIPPLERVLAGPRLERRGEPPGPFAQVGELRQRGGPLLRRHAVEPQLEQIGELVPVAGGPVDLLEQPRRRFAGPGTRQRARQAGERRAFLRELLEHGGEGVHRRLGIRRPLEQDGAPEHDLETPRRVAPPRLCQVGEDRRELLDAPLPGEDPVQRLQRLHVARHGRGELAPGGQLGVHVVGALPGAGREPQEIPGRGAIRRLGRGRVHVGEDPQPPGLLGEARDVGERLLPFPPSGGEGSPGGVEGAGRVAQVDLEEGPDLPLEVGSLGRVLLGGQPVLPDREPRLQVPRRRERLVDGCQRIPPERPRLSRHLEEGLPHARVVRVVGRHLGEQAQGARGVAQPEPPQPGDPEGHLGIEERRGEPLLQRPGQVGRAVELLRELLHLGGRGDVVRVARQALPCVLQTLDRVGGGWRDRQLQPGREVGVVGQLGEDSQESFPVLGRLEARAVRTRSRADCSRGTKASALR